HYSEENFKDAKCFVPERFLKADQEQMVGSADEPISVSAAAYIPFSAGTRACIGERYAMLQMKLAMVSILRKYDIAFVNPDTTLEPQHHMVQGPARFAIKFSRRRS